MPIDEFLSVRDMIDRIKRQMPIEDPTDMQVANLLGVPQPTLAAWLRREKKPLAEILRLCQRTGLDPMKIFFKEHT